MSIPIPSESAHPKTTTWTTPITLTLYSNFLEIFVGPDSYGILERLFNAYQSCYTCVEND